ncbi:hypothetical protein HQ529_01675 [Candidatus Woesearchaeota archaeon]|nr:hypothetical protein [Candidatus Woesearchaeota archaeon]
MNKNKVFGIVMLVLIVLTMTSSLATAAITDTIKNATNNYKHEVVNILVLSVLLITAIALYPKLEKRQREILQFVGIVAAIFIAFRFGADEYFWKIGKIMIFMHLRIWINTLVIIVVGFIIISIPKIAEKLPKEGMAKYAVYLVLFIMAFMIAISPMKDDNGKIEKYPGDDKYPYIWEREYIKPWKFILLGDSECYASDGFVIGKQKDKEIKLSDGEEYYIKDDELYHYDNDWYLGWFQSDEKIELDSIENNKIKEELKGKITITEDSSKGGRYCYTQESKEGVKGPKVLNKGDEELLGFGILRGQNLFIFILGTFLLIWLFNYLLGKENNYINYTISVLLAGSMAHSGMSWGRFILLAEVITWYLLYKGISKGEGASERKWVNMVIAAGLTHMIFMNVAPEHYFSLPFGMDDWGPKAWLYAVIATLAFTKFTGVGAAAAGVGLFGAVVTQEVLKHGLNFIINGVKKIRGVNSLAHELEFLKKRNLKGELPSSFEKNMGKLQVLMNYMLRLQVFKSKKARVETLLKKTIEIFKKYLGKDIEIDRFNKKMDWFLNGPRFIIPGKGFHKRKKESRNEKPGHDKDEKKKRKKFIQAEIDRMNEAAIWNKKVNDGDTDKLKIMNLTVEGENPKKSGEVLFQRTAISNFFYNDVTGYRGYTNYKALGSFATFNMIVWLMENFANDLVRNFSPKSSDIIQRERGYQEESLKDSMIKDVIKDMESDLKDYDRAYDQFGGNTLLRSVKLEVLDQYLMFGAHQHSYMFVPKKRWNKFRKYELDKNREPDENKYLRDAKESEFKEDMIEVDDHGVVLNDKNQIAIRDLLGLDRKTSEVRRIVDRSVGFENMRYRLINPLGMFHHALRFISHEWDGFIDDLRNGRYHPTSRRAEDYINSYRRNKNYVLGDDKIKFAVKPSEGAGAYDEEALKEPGNMPIRYWGRKKWNSKATTDVNDPPFNPFPGISTSGISRYLEFYFKEDVEEESEFEENWARYIKDTGKEKGETYGRGVTKR